jgi:phage-related protein
MAGSRTLKLSILGDVDNLNKSLKSATKDVETFGDKMTKAGKVAGAALAAATVAAGVFAVKIGVEAVKAASNLSETVSKVGVLFGKTSKDIEKFAEGAASSLGQTKQQALDAAATFATFGKAAGLSGQDLSKFSIDFVKLSSDLASFNNTSPEQAINAIGSALRGEAEPLRAYGVLLDDASLRQEALALGIVNTTKNALTPQQKVLAAQALIYKQTGAAQGDFERTSDGLANKTRILTAQLENAKTTIGTALLPIVLQLATAFSEKVIPLVQKFTQAFSNTEGNLGGVVTNVGNILKNTFTPIINGLVAAFGYVRDAIGDNLATFQEFGGYIAKYLAPVIGTVLGGALQVAGKIAGGVIDVIAGVVKILNGLISGAVAGINALISAYNAIPFLPNVSKISTPTVSVPAIKTPTVSTAVPKIPTISAPTTTGATSGGGGGGGVATAAKVAATAAASSAAIPSNFNVGSFRMGEEKDRVGTTINLTVTGAFDKEGTARTIVETLNNSYYRGTGGATNLVAI